jgi:hypothetical protein
MAELCKVGQDKQFWDEDDQYDAEHGKYENAADKAKDGKLENVLPTGAMPLVDTKSPFKIG